MRGYRIASALALLTLARGALGAPEDAAPRTMGEVLAQAEPTDWRPVDPADTLYMELPGGRVVIELAPRFAPRHVENVKTLVRQGYFDGLAVVRSQENYVVQWGDPAEEEEAQRPFGAAASALPAELSRPAGDLPFTLLPDGDVYATEVGFSGGFPAARDPGEGRAWLAHCYGMVGVGRGVDPGSGNGSQLYAVIGHAPRHLDRNVTLVGRVIRGMEHLSTLPRGTGTLGFYEDPGERVLIRAIRVAADLPAAEREGLEALRTDTATFQALVESRRNRTEDWFAHPAGRIGLCNVPLPVRTAPPPAEEERAPGEHGTGPTGETSSLEAGRRAGPRSEAGGVTGAGELAQPLAVDPPGRQTLAMLR